MKVWLGVIGRACIEFLIILILVSFASGATSFVASPDGQLREIYRTAANAARDLLPCAAVITLFLAFFSFETRVKSRLAGWFGLLFLGILLLSFGIGLRRLPLLREALAGGAVRTEKGVELIPTGAAIQRGRVALWIGAIEGREAADAAAVDFGSDYPRLAYSSRAEIDTATGYVDIQGRAYSAARPIVQPIALVPEASIFSGAWIWDRLAAMDELPLTVALAAAGGFLLLAIGFRFLCRLTGWPLANALLAAAGLAGLVVLDAVLSGEIVQRAAEALFGRLGLLLNGPLLVAAMEGALGLVLCAAELAAAPRGRRRSGE
jgi:hypothetical protein